MNRKEATCLKRGLALGLARDKLSVSEISQELKVPCSTIYRWISQNGNQGKVSFIKSPGRPRKTAVCRIVTSSIQHFFRTNDLPHNSIFQDDNAPPHPAARVTHFINDSGVRQLPWPSRSPDLNPIEHVWDHIARKIRSKSEMANSLQQLEEWVNEAWQTTPLEYIDGLINSLPRRVRAVIESHSGHTRY